MTTNETNGRKPSERARASAAHVALTDLASKFCDLVGTLEELREQLAAIVDERTERSDARSDAWAESEKGEAFTEATSTLDDVASTLDGLFDVDELDTQVDNLGTFIDDAYSSGKGGDA